MVSLILNLALDEGDWSASPFKLFTPDEGVPLYQLDRIISRVGVDAVMNRKICSPP
jgi:hypothetical protein